MSDTGLIKYSYRWVILAAFMGINLTIQILWICFAPIAIDASQYFGVTDTWVGVLAMTFMIVYIPFSIPASWLIDRFGFRKAVGIGAVLLGVFGLLRGFAGANFPLALAFTGGVALAQPLLLNSFTTLAAKWFPLEERATVSGLALAASFLGIALGLIITPGLKSHYGIGGMQMIYGVAAAVSAVVFLALVREAPPKPPGPPGSEERALMLDGMKMIVRNRDFWICMFVFFVGVGVFNGIATWIENIVHPKGMTPEDAGWLGGALIIGGIVGAFILPILSDHLRKRKIIILAGMILAVPGMAGFTFLDGYYPLLISLFVLGFFMMGVGPIGYQYGAEITQPAPEGTSNGLLVMAGQVSVVFIGVMKLLNDLYGSFTPSLIMAIGLLVMNCLLIATVKESKLITGEPEGQ